MKRCPRSGASVVTRPDDCVAPGILSLSLSSVCSVFSSCIVLFRLHA